MTRRSNAKDRADKIKQAVDARGDTTASSAKLRSHPDYPAYVNVVGPDDQYQKELLEWAWQRRQNASLIAPLSNEQLLRPRDLTDKISRNNAVYRSDGIVQQLVAKRTRKVYSVLGRVGVIDIYREQLETALDEEGLKLTVADLARVVIDKDGPTLEEINPTIKLLSRLNAGEYVGEGNASTVAGKLHLWVEDLVFDSAIYENAPRQRGPARKRRSAEVRRTKEKQLDKLRENLRRHQVSLTPIRLSEADSIQKIHSAIRGGARLRFEPLPHQTSSDTGRRAAVANFITVMETELGATARRRAINQAWAELENLGVQLWIGQYEDLEPLREPDAVLSEMFHVKAKSHTVNVVVIAFGDINVALSPLLVDLSHTVDLMPSVEQLIAAITDDSPL